MTRNEADIGQNALDLDAEFEEDGADGERYIFLVDSDGARIDRFLAAVGTWSRSYIQSLIDQGNVWVNESKVTAASKKVYTGQTVVVSVPPPAPLEVVPEDIPLAIVFEDEDVIVVNKPRGMVVHPAPGHVTGTLVGALLGHLKQLSGIGGVMRPGIVHRIDKDTSGLLMVAKTDLAHQSLSEQLKEHSVTRVYEAIVHGVIPHASGVIDAPIGRDPQKRQQMAVVADGGGRRAVTHFRVVEGYQGFTHVELQLETGRTHQIRVHMAYIGHPIAGDPVYCRKDPYHLNGQALHARTLGFTHPRTGERLTFHAALPEVLQGVLADLQRIKASL